MVEALPFRPQCQLERSLLRLVRVRRGKQITHHRLVRGLSRPHRDALLKPAIRMQASDSRGESLPASLNSHAFHRSCRIRVSAGIQAGSRCCCCCCCWRDPRAGCCVRHAQQQCVRDSRTRSFHAALPIPLGRARSYTLMNAPNLRRRYLRSMWASISRSTIAEPPIVL